MDLDQTAPMSLHCLSKRLLKLYRRQQKQTTFVVIGALTLNAQIATKVVCFSRLLECLRSLYGKQPEPRSRFGTCSWSTLFDSILNSSVILGNYLQQKTSADNIFRCIFSWRFKG